MISLKKGHDIHHLTNIHLFPQSALCKQLQVENVLMQINIAHGLSPSEDVPVKRLGFLTLENMNCLQVVLERLELIRSPDCSTVDSFK